MPKRFHKHKLILDENMPQRQSLPLLNEHFDVKHIKEDLKQGGVSDIAIYDIAATQGRIILTRNVKHFGPLAGTKADEGIIGIPPLWEPKQIDTKLTALLKKHSPSYFKGKLRHLSTE